MISSRAESRKGTLETVPTNALTIIGRHIVAARGFAGLTQQQLADLAMLDVGTIRRMESFGEEPVGAIPGNLDKVKRALESVGIEFYEEARFTSVRLRK